MRASLVVWDSLCHNLSLSADQKSKQREPEHGRFHTSRLTRVGFAVKAVFARRVEIAAGTFHLVLVLVVVLVLDGGALTNDDDRLILVTEGALFRLSLSHSPNWRLN